MSQSIFRRALIAFSLCVISSVCGAESVRVYVGAYTNGPDGGKGIYLYDFDTASGALKQVRVAAETANPSFLTMSPDQRFMYAVGEVGEFKGQKTGVVSAFSVDPQSGNLWQLNQQSTGGAGPCHVSITSNGKHVFVANYTGGNVSSFTVEPDGKLRGPVSLIQHTGEGADPKRQEGPHAHGIWPAPGDKFVISCDLGLDQVRVYMLDAPSGEIRAFGKTGDVPPGAGVRHAAFSPDGKFIYAINEMKSSVTVFPYDAKAGRISPAVQTISTLPDDFKDKSYCAEIVMHPSGKFVYGSNRGHDSIAVFSIDASSGKLTTVNVTPAGAKWPRNFNIDPSGKWLIAAGEHSNTLAVFKIDAESGKLTQVGEPVECPKPACVVFAPAR